MLIKITTQDCTFDYLSFLCLVRSTQMIATAREKEKQEVELYIGLPVCATARFLHKLNI